MVFTYICPGGDIFRIHGRVRRYEAIMVGERSTQWNLIDRSSTADNEIVFNLRLKKRLEVGRKTVRKIVNFHHFDLVTSHYHGRK